MRSIQLLSFVILSMGITEYTRADSSESSWYCYIPIIWRLCRSCKQSDVLALRHSMVPKPESGTKSRRLEVAQKQSDNTSLNQLVPPVPDDAPPAVNSNPQQIISSSDLDKRRKQLRPVPPEDQENHRKDVKNRTDEYKSLKKKVEEAKQGLSAESDTRQGVDPEEWKD